MQKRFASVHKTTKVIVYTVYPYTGRKASFFSQNLGSYSPYTRIQHKERGNNLEKNVKTFCKCTEDNQSACIHCIPVYRQESKLFSQNLGSYSPYTRIQHKERGNNLEKNAKTFCKCTEDNQSACIHRIPVYRQESKLFFSELGLVFTVYSYTAQRKGK